MSIIDNANYSYFKIEELGTLLAFITLIILYVIESSRPFFKFFKKSKLDRIKHDALNITLGIVNALVISFIFVNLWKISADYTTENNFGLLNWLGLNKYPILHACLAVIIFDLWTYIWHRLNHKVSLLWRFHKLHHSDEEMNVSSAFRFHLLEIVLSSCLRIAIIPLIGARLYELAIYEACMFPVVQLHHSNLALPKKFEVFLSYLIVTPNIHKVHHSKIKVETNSNYSSLFSIWDRLFRSFSSNPKPEKIKFGI